MKSRIPGIDWREAVGDRMAVVGPLLVALVMVAVPVTRWMRGVQLMGTLSENAVALDTELTRLSRDQAEWESAGSAGTYRVLWQSLPDGESGVRDVMAWFKGTAARHGVALAMRVGPAESIGSGDRRIERLRLDLTLTSPTGMLGSAARGGTRAWSDLVEELLAGGVPIQVVSASWAGQGKGLSKCELSTLIWVRPPA